MTLEVQVLTCDRHKKDHNIWRWRFRSWLVTDTKKTITYDIRGSGPDLRQTQKCGGVKPVNMMLCLSQVRTWTSNVICYDLFCVCHKSGPEPLTSYVMVFFVSVTIQDLNLKRHMWWSILCLSQVKTWTSNVICYGLFCVCHKSGPESLTSYVMVFFVSVTSQDFNL
jgi:hypothetical protein